MTIFLLRTWAGKSHSWLTPTTSCSRPRAKRISVAEGSRETMRMGSLYHSNHERREHPVAREQEGPPSKEGGYKCAGCRSFRRRKTESFIEEVFFAHLLEGGEIGAPTGDDFFRGRVFPEEPDRLCVSDELEEFGGIELHGIELSKNSGDLEAHAHGVN